MCSSTDSISQYLVRSTRFTLPYLFRALDKKSDADRMKGALYVMWNKGTAAYALAGNIVSSLSIFLPSTELPFDRHQLAWAVSPVAP